MKWISLTIATGFGLGLSPVAPGTVGSLLGVGIVLLMKPLDLGTQIAVCAGLAVFSVIVCWEGERYLKRKDDRRIVADEYLTFPICMLGLPWASNLWLFPVAFVTNRVMDIVKPPPARGAQALQGGLGVTVDDVISSLYALVANHAILWVVQYLSRSGVNMPQF